MAMSCSNAATACRIRPSAGWLVRGAKEWGLSTLLLVGVLNLLYAVIRSVPHGWWLVAAVGWFVLLVLISKITPAVIVPLFYKMVPLQKSELADRLLALAGRCGVRVQRVFEIKLEQGDQQGQRRRDRMGAKPENRDRRHAADPVLGR